MIFRRRRDIEDEYADYYADDRDRADRRSRRVPVWVHVVIWVVILAAFLVSVRLLAGQTMLEKLLQALAAPMGIVWLSTLLIAYIAAFSRAKLLTAAAFATWLFVTIAGNGLVAYLLARSVESPYIEFDINSVDAFDLVVLLGGGTTDAPTGQPQLGPAGDRLATVARLYHAGKAEKIICCGSSWQPQSRDELEPAEQAMVLLKELGVSDQSIILLTGNNTFQEIQSLDRWLSDQPEKPQRIGIVSSAWHLPRVTRLAKTVGIDAHPIPANFLSSRIKPNPGFIIPSEQNLLVVRNISKEYLARLVGR